VKLSRAGRQLNIFDELAEGWIRTLRRLNPHHQTACYRITIIGQGDTKWRPTPRPAVYLEPTEAGFDSHLEGFGAIDSKAERGSIILRANRAAQQARQDWYRQA
jgi:hypothetical protein